MAANELIYTGEVSEEGELRITNRRGFNLDLKTFFSGKKVKISLKQYRKSRSNKQNGYYHACCVPMVLDGLINAGFERSSLNNEVVHEMLKQKFLTQTLNNELGEFVTVTKSTSELTTTEFMDYIADIQQWGSDFLGIYIPEPNEQSTLNFE